MHEHPYLRLRSAVRFVTPWIASVVAAWGCGGPPDVEVTGATAPLTARTPIVVEAETGTVLGGARTYQDGAASGGSGIAWLVNVGDGVRFQNSPAAESVRIRYATTFTGTLGLYVNGVAAPAPAFSSTGAWTGVYSEVAVRARIPKGATVELRFDSGSVPVNLDRLSFDGQIGGKFTPPSGRTLMFIGQDVGSIADYAATVSSSIGGVTTYTAISESSSGVATVTGLTSNVNYGAGDIHAAQLLASHPHAALAIGLYLVDHTGTNLTHIADGTHNAAIDELGAFIASANRPVFLRIGYEFDGSWNAYDPAKYRAAFRAIVLRLRATGVTNVAFVWQSSGYSTNRYLGAALDQWYPGDDVVDWAGVSYFFYDEAGQNELLAVARAHGKPVLVAEASPQGYQTDDLTFSGNGSQFTSKTAAQIWAEWYAPFFAFVQTNSDVIRGVAYINADWHSQPMWGPNGGAGYWGDTRVQGNAAIESAWLAELATTGWQPGTAAGLAELLP